ncbi:MAG: 50S ribosomal protein L30 [Clostridia bacterium]|nr:50S ribosomal protein L30 [Clostridia bacterium]
MAKKTENKIKVTLVKSTISALPQHRKIVAALGLKKLNSSKIHNANEAILGMINKISYLVKVENV